MLSTGLEGGQIGLAMVSDTGDRCTEACKGLCVSEAFTLKVMRVTR